MVEVFKCEVFHVIYVQCSVLNTYPPRAHAETVSQGGNRAKKDWSSAATLCLCVYVREQSTVHATVTRNRYLYSCFTVRSVVRCLLSLYMRDSVFFGVQHILG